MLNSMKLLHIEQQGLVFISNDALSYVDSLTVLGS